MFVVRRPFRDATGIKPAGSIVEPAGVKRFKHHVLEGHIVEVTEQNFDRYANFFKQRFGVNLPPINPVANEETKNDSEVQPPEATAEVPAKPKAAEVKATEVKKVVAAVAK